MWVARVAHSYQRAVSDVYSWPHSDLVAAVASLVSDAHRCPGCGLAESDQRWVAADLVTCPTCEDRDRQLESLREMKSTAGWRARFRQLATVSESMLESSWARFTIDGARAREAYRKEHRDTSA